ncbi:MAG: RNA polymerase sigma factor [Planctomycetota bacterium]|jgi:RNA polymerase sigma-70 factor (ECF subfamily)
MDKDIDHISLVEQARLGDKKSLDQLVKLSQESLRDDVYRMSLDAHLTEDIVQETLLEMVKILGELKESDRFWPWLYKIALNKLRLHHRREKVRSTVPMSEAADMSGQKRDMPELLAEELKEVVSNAMGRLKPQHRTVLTLRCYKDMEYAGIAETMGCSEFAARKLFWRAKRSLGKQLARQGLGKGSLVMALIVFGKMTAASEAAAAKVSVGAGATKVGAAAAIAGMAGSKAAILSMVTVGVLGVSTLVVTPGTDGKAGTVGYDATGGAAVSGQVSQAGEEYWYLFPEGKDGPVVTRFMKKGLVQWVQDEEANWFFDKRSNTVHMNNYRQFRSDMGLWRLPTDDGGSGIDRDGPGLVMVVSRGENGDSVWQTRHENIMSEEYFRYSWPGGVGVVDNRDSMHKRGWTYFTVEGHIGSERVTGQGRIPFVYASADEHWAWMKLRIGDKEIADTSFAGFSRPWMGLHTVDTVRRDAVKQGLKFETRHKPGENMVEIMVKVDEGGLVYTIDIDRDVVEKVVFSTRENNPSTGSGPAGGQRGEFVFSYLEDVRETPGGFVEPRRRNNVRFSILDLRF